MKTKLLFLLIVSVLLAVVLAVGKVYYAIEIWRYSGPDVEFQIHPGERFSKINYRLYKNKLISNPNVFHRYAQINNIIKKFKAGKYLIKHNYNMLEVINTLVYGKPLTKAVTIPEGKNIFEVGKLLEKSGIVSYQQFIDLAKNDSFTHDQGLPGNRLEGYLYPDTYNFSLNSKAKHVIDIMLKQFRSKTQKLDFTSCPLPLSKHEVIILASIVEKETGASKERPIIAGVFLNRLKRRMRLESDPTTIYGIFESFNGNLQRKHLQEKTPYNTYRISGLPVGPICNPGIESIKAVLYPQKHNYLYFVSKNDGTHIFTKSYNDHAKAVQKYQKTYSNRAGKSWRNLEKSSN